MGEHRRRWALTIVGASLLLATAVALGGADTNAGADEGDLTAGTIVVHDRMGERDTVEFLFPPDTDPGRAEGIVRVAARTAGLPDSGVEAGDWAHASNVDEFDLTTTVGT